MEHAKSKRRFGPHFIVVFCSTGFLTIVPMAIYGGLIVWSGDLGGPLNLVIIPATSAMIGLGVSLVVFVPVSLLAESSGFRRWRQVVGGLLAVLTGVVVLARTFVGTMSPHNRVLLAAGSLCLYFAGGFFVHLCRLAVCRRIWPPSPSNRQAPHASE